MFDGRDATMRRGEAHFTEEESTVGYLSVLRDTLEKKAIARTVYGDRHSS